MAFTCHLAVYVQSRLAVKRIFSAGRYSIFNAKKLLREFQTSSVITSSEWGTKKKSRKLKLKLNFPVMADPQHEEILAPLRLSVKEQGDIVRKLKAENAPEFNIKKAVAELKIRKKKLEDAELSLLPNVYFDRNKMEDLLKRRFFYDISFSIYGGVSGQFDFGPMGCALKNNIVSFWRSFFVLEEQMLEVDCSIITPEPVFKTSGHVDRFADLMVKDKVNGECFRLDHLIKSSLEKIMSEKNTPAEVKEECKEICIKLDGMTKDEMSEVLKKFNIKSPLTNNELSEPMEFNLMFSTEIGPTGLVKGFLRPETAQGIFVNFERLLEFNQGRLPFAAAQVGQAFRNEISPRSGLIRVREFTLAEIEHFCHPNDKSHSKFPSVADTILTLYSACNQMDGKGTEQIAIGDAVKSGLVANETLGYFMARIYLFLLKIGIDPTKVRFRQHMANEMAHYACDCWDAECLTSYGWVECVGCADRSAYDLTQHSKFTRKRLVAETQLPEPKVVEVNEIVLNNKIAGKEFKSHLKVIRDTLADYDEEKIQHFEAKLKEEGVFTLEIGDQKFQITKEMASVERYKKLLHVEEYTPSVIEPSFGIGRIMYSLFEHSFKIRPDDDKRTYFSFPPCVAPIKCSILPLRSRDETFEPFVKKLTTDLNQWEIPFKLDDGAGSIGRRYARTDEISIPFAITIDNDTLQEPHTVTLRERDSTIQVRVPIEEVAIIVNDICKSRLTWKKVREMYPKYE